MIKIFLVEDEVIVRQGIKNRIDWQQYGYKFVGEASDGELALPMILKLKPDVIVTDITMPFMDGLELSKLVKQEMPWVKIVILSGFDDFEYAKKAIRIGVTEYLLKPITKVQIIKTLVSIREIIQQEQKENDLIKQLEGSNDYVALQKKNELFTKLMSKNASITNIIDDFIEANLEIIASTYTVVIMKPMYFQEYDIAQKSTEILYGYLSSFDNVIVFNRGIDGFVLLLKGENEDEYKGIDTFIGFIENFLESTSQFDFIIAIGKTVNRISDILQSYQTANKIMAQKYMAESETNIYNYSEQKPLNDINFANIDPGSIDREIIKRFLKTGTHSEVDVFIEEYFDKIGEEHLGSMIFRQYIVLDIQFCSLEFTENLGIAKDLLLPTMVKIELGNDCVSSIEVSKHSIKELIKNTLSLRDDKINKGGVSWLSEAKEYIQENYNSKEISLKTVSDNVNISPSHFSNIFSNEIGKSFIEYVTELRIEKAKELLRCSSKKTAEIADEIGYNDPQYFSVIFKKTLGITPREFRNGKEGQ